MDKKHVIIASRNSPLALWQTNEVKKNIQKLNINCEIKPIESTGDIQLNSPIYSLGINGVFTKELDLALLNKEADIAVHSLKDVPTTLAKGLFLVAVLPRANPYDILLFKNNLVNFSSNLIIATSSLRRKAQWLKKYPNHSIIPIRGNVQTRLKKYNETKNTDGVIFAYSGLERMKLIPENSKILDWMIPAPSQGIIGIVCREDDKLMLNLCKEINDLNSYKMGYIERQFMNYMQGGCSVPISAISTINNEYIDFKGSIHSFDGSECFYIEKKYLLKDWYNIGKLAAIELLNQNNAKQLLEIIKNNKP